MAEAKRYNLAEFVEAKRRDDGIVVELSDGSTITVPPGILWPLEALDAMRRADMAEATRLFLGDEQHERFTADGGNWRILDAILRDATGVDMGEPPASSST